MNHLHPWLPFSFLLAKYLEKNEIHKQFLTITERKYFEDILTSYSTWIAFVNQPHSENDSNNEIETTSFRVRSMLYEQLIPHLFHKHKQCCHVLPVDSILSEARQLTLPSMDEISQAWSDFLETHAKVKKEEPTTPHSANEESKEKPEQEGEEQTQVNETKLEETNVNLDNVPLRDIYHSLELDTAAMIEQRKLQEFEAQEELNEAEEARENAAAKSLSMFNADGNFNLKYLLQGIVANRQRTSLSDRDLQNLLSDFKPHRSKWANDDRVGQEELYEACEKVLTDLKNYTEHSTPFLNKVSKREAPDYFEVIKKPMDLGTVTKKMKNLVYKSKKEFADDLYLIYDNCLTYNTNAASEYRKHAIAMRKKTERLLVRVPNISIKEIKTEAEEEGDDMSEEEDHHDRGRVSRKTAGKHMVSSKHQRKSTPAERERSMTRGSSAAPEMEMTPEVDTPSTGFYGGKHVKNDQSGENVDLEQEDMKLGAEIDADMGEFQDQVWRDKTKKTRAKLTTDVEKQYQFEFGEREALVRSSLDMGRFSMIEHLHDKPESIMKLVRCEFDRFLKWTDRRPNGSTLYDDFDLDSSDDENLDAFFSRKITKPNKVVDDSTRNDLFLADYETVGGIPEIKGLPEDIVEPASSGKAVMRKSSVELSPENLMAALGFSNVSLDVYPELKFPDYGLNPYIDKSIATLEQIKLMYAKCNAVKNNVAMSTLTSSMEAESPPNDDEEEEHQEVTMPSTAPPLILNSESSYQVTQKVISKLLTHAGFEGAKTGAMNVLSDVMIDYMTNIGKTMRSYWDSYSHQMNGDEMLSHVLYENGILDMSDLETYVHDDVERNVQRLEDLNRRLQTSYQDLLSGPTEKAVDDEELLDDEETFVAGMFGEDIGEDYFGFKNLGLDQEYNLESLQIPNRLWFGKDKDKSPIKKDIKKEPLYRFPPPPSFVPITSEKPLIGLLQPYFAKKLSDPGHPLIEDEYIPNRNRNKPRYPPSNKPTQGRKKLNKEASGAGAGAGGEHKKHKRKRPAEEINAEKAEKAERRRLKLEEREKRIAEKEQKRKLKVELKEQEKQARIEAKEKKKLMNKKAKQKTQPNNEEEEEE